MITDKELSNKLEVYLNGDDEEVNHIRADELLANTLIELGYKESISIYSKIHKWYA